MRTPNLNQNQEGFSLIEIVVSLFMVGVVFVIYAAAANTLALNRTVRNQETALRIANSKIEEIRSTDFNSLPTASGTFSDPTLANLPQGNANLTVISIADKLKQFDVSVTWIEPGAAGARSVSVTTYATPGGVGK